jgi:hypothetical protein
MPRKTVMRPGQVQRFVIPQSGGVCSALPAHHEVDPDRGEGGRAALRNGIVPIDSQLLANAIARLRSLGKWIPISARVLFIVHCTTGSAVPIFGLESSVRRDPPFVRRLLRDTVAERGSAF